MWTHIWNKENSSLISMLHIRGKWCICEWLLTVIYYVQYHGLPSSFSNIFQDVQLQGLNSTARLSVQSEKVNLNHHVVNMENNFWISFASLTRSALEGYGACEVAMTQNFQKQISCTKHVGPTINILSPQDWELWIRISWERKKKIVWATALRIG